VALASFARRIGAGKDQEVSEYLMYGAWLIGGVSPAEPKGSRVATESLRSPATRSDKYLLEEKGHGAGEERKLNSHGTLDSHGRIVSV
jgi:hypothetical protein